MPPRNKLGQSARYENNIVLPSLGTLVKKSLIFIVIYPWFNILSNVGLKMSDLYNFAMDSIPERAQADDDSSFYKPIENNGTYYIKPKVKQLKE